MFERHLGIERLGTIREIAELTKLGEGTVHRALKGRGSVSLATRERVIAAVCQINARKIQLAQESTNRNSP